MKSVIFLCLNLFLASLCFGKKMEYVFALGNNDKYVKAIDLNGNVLADSLFNISWSLFERYRGGSLVPFCIPDGKMGFKNLNNKIVIPPCYDHFNVHVSDDEIDSFGFVGGLCMISSSGKFGLINQKGNLVADTTYDYIGPMQDNVFVARKKNQLYILNKEGKNTLQYAYQTDAKLFPKPKFENGLLCVVTKFVGKEFVVEDMHSNALKSHLHKVGFINVNGKLVIDTVYEIQEGMLVNTYNESKFQRVNMDGVCGNAFKDKSYTENIPIDPFILELDYYRFINGYCLVNNGASDILINKQGTTKIIIDKAFEIVFRTENGIVLKDTNGKFGLLNSKNKLALPYSYPMIMPSNNRSYLVMDTSSGYFFINSFGKKIFEKNYTSAEVFYEKISSVSFKDNKNVYFEGTIDTTGHFFDFDKYYCEVAGSRHLVVTVEETNKNEEGTGIMNYRYKWKIKPLYSDLHLPKNGYVVYSPK